MIQSIEMEEHLMKALWVLRQDYQVLEVREESLAVQEDQFSTCLQLV